MLIIFSIYVECSRDLSWTYLIFIILYLLEIEFFKHWIYILLLNMIKQTKMMIQKGIKNFLIIEHH